MAVLLWLVVLRRRLARKLEYLVVAFVACTISNMMIEFACAYLVPLDVAGMPPPDPRNVQLRLLITAGIQVPVALVLSYYIAARTRIDRWQQPVGK